MTQQPERRYDVFISHSSRRDPDDHELVDALAAALCRRGLTVFVDRSSLREGMQLVPSLGRALDSTSVGLIVLTRRALESGWVALELEVMAQRCTTRRMRVVALRLDASCPLPHGITPDAVIDPQNRFDLIDIADQIAQIVWGDPSRR